MKKVALLITLISLLYFGYNFKYAPQKYIQKPNIDKELKKVATKNYLEQKLKEALNSNNLEDALIYINLAKYLHISLNNKLIEEYNKTQEPLQKSIRDIKDFANGFISGKSNNSISLSGAVVSDLTIVGDVRDIYKEGKKYINNQDYDKFILGISILGVALTTSEFITLGATIPLKSAQSLIKIAYKGGYISKNFKAILLKKMDKTVDFKLIKSVDFSSFSSTKNSLQKVINSINPKPFKELFAKLEKISKNSSIEQTIKLLKYINSEKDLDKIVKISKKYKKNSLGVFKVLGKRALKGSKIVIKYGTKFILNLIAFFISLIGFIITLFSLLPRAKKV